jgi:outer membrane protein assembly factor BamB
MAEDPTRPVPEVCPYCYERLRPCPVCGAPNSWLARRCHIDPAHVIRSAPDWGVLGGSPTHVGSVDARADAALSRRWSFPSVPPSRREYALAWSAPVAAYGLVAGAAATNAGDAHLYAFDTRSGAPLWEPYPLADPVYPDRGGAALAGGRLFAATVEGVCVVVDALRGTRLWETNVGGKVYGAVVPVGPDGPLLVPVATKEDAGCLLVLDAMNGTPLRRIPLPGPPDSAPACADGLVFAHDDGGGLTTADLASGDVLWRADCGAGFDAAPIVRDGRVFSATSAGVVWCHEAATGKDVWRVEVTNAPFSGTPAVDGTLLYLPADDGLHLVSEAAGRAVRRYPTRLPVRSAPVVAGGTVFFGATDGNVYGAAPGRPLEKVYETGMAGSQIVAAPAFADGCLFIAATNGVLYALAHQPPQETPPGAR